MVEISSGLLLGNIGDVIRLLGTRPPIKVTHLLSIINKPIDWSDIHSPQGSLLAKLINVPDMPSTDLLSHFPSCISFISDGMQQHGTVLVHCEYGISRSATIVLAYIMKTRKLTLKEAIEHIKDKKPDIRPNDGFIQQLKLWEAMKYQLDERHKSYRAYKLHHQANKMRDTGYMETMELMPDPISCSESSYYSCRKCRRQLFNGSNVLQHELGMGFTSGKSANTKGWWIFDELPVSVEHRDDHSSPSPFDGESVLTTVDDTTPTETKITPEESYRLEELSRLRLEITQITEQSHDRHMTCSSLFIEPVEWMAPLLVGVKDGKLLCPKCSSRIGSFDWSGSQCSCGRWITPAFQVHKSKIDTHSKSK
jgi:dual specificity phosphatase 12